MLEKKLITLACVAGILACGACFGPIHTPPPPPPPPIFVSNGIHNVNVSVSNASLSHHVDPDQLAGAIANTFNQRTWGTGVIAHVQQQSGKGTAALDVTIVSENATPFPPRSQAGTEKWIFAFKISATLTTENGQVIWQEKNTDYSFTNWLPQEDPEAAWQDLHVRLRAPHFISVWMVTRIFNREQSNWPPGVTPLQ